MDEQVNPDKKVLDRSRWVTALSKISASRIFAVAEQMCLRYQAEHRQVPQAGLGVVALRDAVVYEPFYLGEFPLSTARVALTDSEGRIAEGAACVMTDNARLAAAMAVCDAVLASRWPGWEEAEALLREGAATLAREARVRGSMLRRCRVDFSLLNADEETSS